MYVQNLDLQTVGGTTWYAERFLALQRSPKLKLSKFEYVISYQVILKTIYTFPEYLFALFTEELFIVYATALAGGLRLKPPPVNLGPSVLWGEKAGPVACW